jgi:hypothetical protein
MIPVRHRTSAIGVCDVQSEAQKISSADMIMGARRYNLHSSGALLQIDSDNASNIVRCPALWCDQTFFGDT